MVGAGGGVVRWGLVAERGVSPAVVVIRLPVADHHPRLHQCPAHGAVAAFVAHPAVERLDVAVAPGWPGRGAVQADAFAAQSAIAAQASWGPLSQRSTAGSPDLHPHRFRHTFAHQWLRLGGNETGLMRIAGLRSRQMLQRYGASAADARARDAHRRVSLAGSPVVTEVRLVSIGVTEAAAIQASGGIVAKGRRGLR
jgi:hypothetical protein